MRNLISVKDLSKEDILGLIDIAEKIEKKEISPELKDKVISLLFFEPSTRTRFSFETAVKRLSGKTLYLGDVASSSVTKGETFADTVQVISQYSDMIVMRTQIEGAPRYASEILDIPIVNAGDGTNQHPTQALLDIYSIHKTQKDLKNLKIGLVGDLKLGRTVHSLCQIMSDFNPEFYFVSPEFLKMPNSIKNYLTEKGINYHQLNNVEEVVGELDILYVTRLQKERFSDLEAYERVKDYYSITSKMLTDVKPNLKILHPLPRVNEISTCVDSTPYAYYFQQAKNGMFMRQAIISKLFGVV
jgi:aspartate carbamoyltransferase catalytic subunit